MYRLPSTSVRRAPSPRAKNSGSPPTALKARTGELTPPGMTWRALSNRLRERVPMGCSARSAPQQPGRLLGEVGDDEIGPGAAYGDERLHHDALAIDPAVARRGRQHGVLARDVVGGDRHADRLAHAVD